MTRKLFRGCDSIYYVTLRLCGCDQIGYSYGIWNPPYRYRNNIPYIGTPTKRAYDIIDGTCFLNSPCEGDTLYVEPKARIFRDLLRNSGYKITRSPEKADAVIIPEPDPSDFCSHDYKLLAYDYENNRLFMCTVNRSPRASEDVSEEDIALLLKKMRCLFGEDLEFFYCSGLKCSFRMTLVPPIESYLDILEDKYPDRIYTSDEYVRFTPTSEINIETLEVWSRITEDDILEKCIAGCDWHKYPYTLHVFLNAEHTYDLRRVTSKSVNMALEFIHSSTERAIEPEDWNMLQQWVMHKLGLDSCEKAWIDMDKYQSLDMNYRSVLRTKVAASPVLIDRPDMCNNIKESVQKS